MRIVVDTDEKRFLLPACFYTALEDLNALTGDAGLRPIAAEEIVKTLLRNALLQGYKAEREQTEG